MICKAAEIILTLSATFKASADQQSVDVKTDFTFLGHDDLFSQIYMTPPEGQTQVIARAQSISLIHCLFRLVKCKFTEPHYKSAWYTLLSLLIFSTYAPSIKREGRNLTKKKKEISRLLRLLHSSAVMLSKARYCDIAVTATALHTTNIFFNHYCLLATLLSLHNKILRMMYIVETRSDSGHLRGKGSRKNSLSFSRAWLCWQTTSVLWVCLLLQHLKTEEIMYSIC